MACPRCTGLLVGTWLVGEDAHVEAWRCVNCVEQLDAVIVQNRQNPVPYPAEWRDGHAPGKWAHHMRRTYERAYAERDEVAA